MSNSLPEPSPDALRASAALCDLIHAAIASNDGWISFARYMELALYAPGLGYYSGGAVKLGRDGDFTTAPEMTPLFGQTLAQVLPALMPPNANAVLEFGAGSGRLARDLLQECAARGTPLRDYAIVELSGELRARQQQLLTGFSQVRWLDCLPAQFAGVVFANEVLDAMPCELVVKTADGWRQRGVATRAEEFVFADRECDASLNALIDQIPHAEQLPLGYVTELQPAALAFIAALAPLLKPSASAAILIDYGFPAHEYYLAQRAQGTLMCHYRHRAHADPFYLPGLQDITTHVDFSACARAALDAGLDLLGYLSQAAFLLEAGIGDLLLRTAPSDALRYLPQANALQKLVSPAEMGELFKVLVIGAGGALPENFQRHDRSHRL